MSNAPFQLFESLDPTIAAALSESIQRFGVLVPVVVDQNGNTLDGHHRRAIADRLGVKYRTDVLYVADDDEAREIALTLNADRRQLDAEQRRRVVAALLADVDEAGVGRHSPNAIAGALGVSLDTVQRDAEQVTDVGNLPDRRRGKDGKVYPTRKPTVVPAKNDREAERAQAALSDLGDETPLPPTLDVKRAERLNRERKAEQRRQEPVLPTGLPDSDLRHGDFRDCLSDLKGQVDAIITDPPYPAEFVDLFDDLGMVASELLKPNGVLVAMVGQSHLPRYIDLLSMNLAYRWTGAYMVQGPRNRVHRAAVGTGWKPLLIFQPHGAEPSFLLDDTFKSTGDDKDHHIWGQSESGMASIVDRFAGPGDLVVDPFLGGGTTGVVCQGLGIRFVGCDVDAACVHASRDRIA